MTAHLRGSFLVSGRVGAILAVFGLGAVAFSLGVGTEGLPDLARQSLAAKLYYTAGLFVFGGLDLGIPAGGTPLGRTALWTAYFLAPVVTTSALAEAFVRIVRPGRWMSRRLRGHVVIVGAGQVGRIYGEVVRTIDQSQPLLFVDQGSTGPTLGGLNGTRRVHFLQGDARAAETLQGMNLRHARALVSITDSDLVNLMCAWAARSRQPTLDVSAHVSDLTLLRPIDRIINAGAAPEGFNTHKMGAEHVYRTFLSDHFVSTQYSDVVVLAGFGRFAQSILEVLLRQAPDELAKIIIVDRTASVLARQFEADVAPLPRGTTVVDGDMTDPAVWQTIQEAGSRHEGDPVILLCAGDEVENLRAALQLRSADAGARIFARCFQKSAFSVALAKESTFELLAFDEMLREALRSHYLALVDRS